MVSDKFAALAGFIVIACTGVQAQRQDDATVTRSYGFGGDFPNSILSGATSILSTDGPDATSTEGSSQSSGIVDSLSSFVDSLAGGSTGGSGEGNDFVTTVFSDLFPQSSSGPTSDNSATQTDTSSNTSSTATSSSDNNEATSPTVSSTSSVPVTTQPNSTGSNNDGAGGAGGAGGANDNGASQGAGPGDSGAAGVGSTNDGANGEGGNGGNNPSGSRQGAGSSQNNRRAPHPHGFVREFERRADGVVRRALDAVWA